MSKEIIIEIKNLNKSYFLKNKKIDVLKNLNVKFNKGMFYAIMGHSGCGKTTLINIIGLIDNLSDGDYILNGQNIKNLTDNEKAYFRQKYIGFIFQDFYLDEHLKAFENVMLPMMLNKNISYKEKRRKASKILEELDLKNREDHFPKHLSGGEKQRVAIARAIANNPEIILADEPTGNLDVENEDKIFKILKDLSKKGKCVIVVSHSNEVKKYADQVFWLKDGNLVGDDNESSK